MSVTKRDFCASHPEGKKKKKKQKPLRFPRLSTIMPCYCQQSISIVFDFVHYIESLPMLNTLKHKTLLNKQFLIQCFIILIIPPEFF